MLCCFFFSRSCFIQTENNISNDKKQNKYMSISDTSSPAVKHVSALLLWMSKHRGSATAFLQIYHYIFRPFSFDSTKQLKEEEERKEYGGSGTGADEHFVGLFRARFQLAVHLADRKKMKCSSGLQLSSICNRS